MRLKVFTFNCWAIAYVPFLSSPDRKPRVHAIAKYLAQNDYDIACLQELWTNSDREIIKSACQKVLPHSITFHGGVIGTGTMILSKWPILESNFRQFSLNGFKHEIWYGDALAGSGIGLAKLMVGTPNDHFLVNTYVSHYHAEYNRDNDRYLADRVVQALEAGEFINWTSTEADAVIYCGDLNTEPGDLPYNALRRIYGLTDAQSEVEPKFATCYATENTYRLCDGDMNPRAKTIDYILYKSLVPSEVVHIGRPLSGETVEATGKSFSDHEALAAILSFGEINAVVEKSEPASNTAHLQVQVRQILDQELQLSKRWSVLHLILVIVLAIIFPLVSYNWPSCTLVLGFFALAGIAFHLSMVSVYLERQCSLKATMQSHCSFGLVQGSAQNNTKNKTE